MQFKPADLVAVLFFATLITLATGVNAADIDSLVGKDGVYTLTNLHPDTNRNKLYSVNFQQQGLIPLCTEVEILKVGNRKITFKVKDSGMEYKYLNHKTAGEDLRTNAARYFGTECVKDKVAKLSKKDQEGISQGKALVGMSKQGVIYAIGYPPLGATPSTDSSNWKYWFNRFNTFAVTFDGEGIVTQVIN